MKGNKPTDNYCTPKELTDLLPEFDLDPCSNPNSTVRAKRAVMLPEDGLAAEWRGNVFVNCPYSNVMPWAEKAVESADTATTCLLLKMDPTTRWFSRLMLGGDAVAIMFRKRIKFVDPGMPQTAAKFPSVLMFVGWRRPGGAYFDIINPLRREGWIW